MLLNLLILLILIRTIADYHQILDTKWAKRSTCSKLFIFIVASCEYFWQAGICKCCLELERISVVIRPGKCMIGDGLGSCLCFFFMYRKRQNQGQNANAVFFKTRQVWCDYKYNSLPNENVSNAHLKKIHNETRND